MNPPRLSDEEIEKLVDESLARYPSLLREYEFYNDAPMFSLLSDAPEYEDEDDIQFHWSKSTWQMCSSDGFVPVAF